MKITLKHDWMVPHIVTMNDGRTVRLDKKESEISDADAIEILDKHAPLFEESAEIKPEEPTKKLSRKEKVVEKPSE